MDLRYQPRSGRELQPQSRPRSAARHDLERQQGRSLQSDGQHRVRGRLIPSASLLFPTALLALHTALTGWSAWFAPPSPPLFPLRRLAHDVYAVMGDTGRGSEGRANAGFVVTRDGVVVIDAEGSPRDGETLLRTIRSVSKRPIRWLVLTHHHPDHHFGAIVFRKAGAKVVAHPDTRTLASEGGLDNQMIDWIRVVGLDAMRGFE